MTTYEKQMLTCPSCSGEVVGARPMSTNVVGQDTDFRRISRGINIRELVITTCRRCGFTGVPEDFDAKLSKEVADRLSAEIAPLVRQQRVWPEHRWEYAALLSEWRGQTADEIAQRYLNAAWCVREQGSGRDVALENRYRRKAAEWFEAAVGPEPRRESAVTSYLIGELYRRVGETEVAHRWFNLAVQLAQQHAEVGWVVELATQQKTAPQERG